MPKDLELDDFLARNRLSKELWEKSQCDWKLLTAIAVDHSSNFERLRESAEFFARLVQKFNGVHSVRWRVKGVENVLKKIVRKRAEGVEKYAEISADNYFEVITDLVGLRALHLFKDDCFLIDEELRASWKPIEQPLAYIREGDRDEMTRRFAEKGFTIKSHPAGYRSVHYVFQSQPLHRKVITELQVRTIFEEGWSEIDHRVRYPNFSDNELVDYFLTIFNRMAGSADEMGGFVRGLAANLQQFQRQLTDANREREGTVRKLEKMVTELDGLKQQDKESKAALAALKVEIEALRQSTKLESLVFSRPPLATAPALLDPDALSRILGTPGGSVTLSGDAGGWSSIADFAGSKLTLPSSLTNIPGTGKSGES